MSTSPKLSIIIPCFNLSAYLSQAIQSCLSIPNLLPEIIVVDDGSTDATTLVAASFPHVRYFYQPNRGLPAARNTGLTKASGEFICFLDADDWLIPENIHISLHILQNHPDAALVFGCHLVQQENGSLRPHCPTLHLPVYRQLLRSNIIGNPSAAIYRREVLLRYPFSTNPAFRGCEDYHQYLHIARHHLVLHHRTPVTIYRRHQGNMSNNWAMMLDSALNVLNTQLPLLQHEEENSDWIEGRRSWLKYYSYFPLRAGGKFHLNRHHWALVRKLGWGLPWVLTRKIFRCS